jgi:hypothetical protein
MDRTLSGASAVFVNNKTALSGVLDVWAWPDQSVKIQAVSVESVDGSYGSSSNTRASRARLTPEVLADSPGISG